eukprot:m51a1_g9490 putative ring finger protein 165 (171) ;mRNA; f:638186-638698
MLENIKRAVRRIRASVFGAAHSVASTRGRRERSDAALAAALQRQEIAMAAFEEASRSGVQFTGAAPAFVFAVPSAPPAVPQRREHGRRAAEDAEALSRLPTREWSQRDAESKGRGDEGEASRCGICLSDYEVGEVVRTLPCLHGFHAECVDRWLLSSDAHCPVCRCAALP